jgi:threonine aldolase
MDFIDLRSDTVTKPTPQMREAMAAAEVGDDVYGEDPTVNRLQEKAAAMLGKEAALFVPSGTMGNLASLLAHCQRGDEVVLGDLSHTFLLEAGGMAVVGGIQPRTVPNQEDGTLDLEDVQAAIRSDDAHFPVTRLISLESTHNRCRGAALTASYCREIGELARQHNLALHLDGARIFNAAAALGEPVLELAAPFDSVTFCLSKGLSAPAGSLIVGSVDFIRKVHRARKLLGGGMRQAGVLAAAGIVALDTMVERLADDHVRARELARLLAGLPGLVVENPLPASNMVYVGLDGGVGLGGREFGALLKEKGVKIGSVGHRRFRLVTHYWIGDEQISAAVKAFSAVLALG